MFFLVETFNAMEVGLNKTFTGLVRVAVLAGSVVHVDFGPAWDG